MAAITRLSSGGYGTRRTGSFAGRAPVVVTVAAEAYSGGWRRHPVSRFEKARATEGPSWRRFGRTESDSERKARIHADRIRLGIIAPDPEKPTAPEAAGATIAGEAAPLLPPEAAGFDAAAYDGLALDLAGLHTGAYLDELIARNFQILDDEDDAAVLMLAIAVLH